MQEGGGNQTNPTAGMGADSGGSTMLSDSDAVKSCACSVAPGKTFYVVAVPDCQKERKERSHSTPNNGRRTRGTNDSSAATWTMRTRALPTVNNGAL